MIFLKKQSGEENKKLFFLAHAGWIAAGILIFFLPYWIWFFWRIEPKAGEIAVLIRKTGEPLPSGKILATEIHEKGIQMDVLPEGRYFYNPYTWDWQIKKITDIPAGKLGVQIRLFGKDLPEGKIIAGNDEKGILKEVLMPGRYRINPYAYEIRLFNAISVPLGSVGVLTQLTGKDILTGPVPDNINTYLVGPEEKGVQTTVYPPGTYYLNPYLYMITIVNLKSQRFEMSKEDSINFLSQDGFTITVEGTLEWAVKQDSAPLITTEVGDLDDVLNKIILPAARGFSRIEGSKKPAIDYIMGETRQEFQDKLAKHLTDLCGKRGIEIRSVLIRNIIPPQKIAGIIRQRQIAVQNRRKYEQQIAEAQSRAELAKQEELANQNREKIEQETIKIRAVINAQQQQSVALTEANKNLEVAKLHNEAADFQAKAKVALGEAQRDVIKMKMEAEANALQQKAQSFKDGSNWARYVFYQTIAKKIMRIFTDDQGAIGNIFNQFTSPHASSSQKGGTQ
ncbi:MAG: hypothetical protein JW774_08335 [Candidatus Aureabacteria bacterium]|nr:hypothetical protein [Candidatus Auribacterota bacterium]